MNGSGLLLLNPPFGLDERLRNALSALRAMLEEGAGRGDSRLTWLRSPD
jgi:23S rRNA A2030 N6-methylase RlmJ